MPGVVMIDVKQVGKHFGRSKVRALDDVTLNIARGRVTAVVGPNGAGKSTLFAVILGFLHTDAGDVTIDELDPRDYVRENGVSYVPDRFTLPAAWPVGKAVSALGAMAGASPAQIQQSLADFGVDDLHNRKVGDLSRGLLQRVGLAQAFATPRDLIVLDEPSEGLDPIWRIRLRDRIAAERARGRTILLASHDIAEVERVADCVVVLENGAVKETLDLANENFVCDVWDLVLAADFAVESVFPDAIRKSTTEFTVSANGIDDLNRRIAALIELGARVARLQPSNTSLEERVRSVIDS